MTDPQRPEPPAPSALHALSVKWRKDAVEFEGRGYAYEYGLAKSHRACADELDAALPARGGEQDGLVTECCHVPIDDDWRFCPKCGYEARVIHMVINPARAVNVELVCGEKLSDLRFASLDPSTVTCVKCRELELRRKWAGHSPLSRTETRDQDEPKKPGYGACNACGGRNTPELCIVCAEADRIITKVIEDCHLDPNAGDGCESGDVADCLVGCVRDAMNRKQDEIDELRAPKEKPQ